MGTTLQRIPELAILSRLDLADFSRLRLAVQRHVSNARFFFFFSGLISSGWFTDYVGLVWTEWWWSNKLEAKSWSQGFPFGRAPSPSKTRFGWLMRCLCTKKKQIDDRSSHKDVPRKLISDSRV